MADHTQRTQYPLIKGQDYEDLIDEGGLHFSVSGIYKLSQAFGECLTKRNRREECKDVGEVIKPQVDDIVSEILKRGQRIEKAKKNAKRRDGSVCRVTEKTRIR